MGSYFGVAAGLLRVHVCSSVVSFCAVYASQFTPSEAVENLIRVNSRNSWPIKPPRIPRISRKRSLRFGCHWLEIQFFMVSPAAPLDAHVLIAPAKSSDLVASRTSL